jgi:hypothetical protein
MSFGLRNTRLLFLLVLAILFQGMAPVFAMPTPVDGHVAVMATEATDHCQENVGEARLPHQSHGKSACQIACDLGSAPTLTTKAIPLVTETLAILVPVMHQLMLADATPPDTPPPI